LGGACCCKAVQLPCNLQLAIRSVEEAASFIVVQTLTAACRLPPAGAAGRAGALLPLLLGAAGAAPPAAAPLLPLSDGHHRQGRVAANHSASQPASQPASLIWVPGHCAGT
jgi:hypothetical protein